MSTSENFGAGQRRPEDWERLETELQQAREEMSWLADVAEAAYQYRHHGDRYWCETLDAAITSWRRKAGLTQVELLATERAAKVEAVVETASDAGPTIRTIRRIGAREALLNDDELAVLSALNVAVDDLVALEQKKKSH